MRTRVVNVRGRLHEYGPRLEHAPVDLVYVGRRWTMGGWDLPKHPLYNPFAYDTPARRRDGTRAEVMAKYRPDLLALLPGLRGKALACWCAPEPCHAEVLAELAEELS
ncbi:DUF4326 domain-containing protein [Streptomyces sviceus]|uniref:DUF4326 domain-containing protein n=1 Tax=Streptomyces sviceus TaxID=285530 RepID=UPI00332E1564